LRLQVDLPEVVIRSGVGRIGILEKILVPAVVALCEAEEEAKISLLHTP
jgi:hypothetical protein